MAANRRPNIRSVRAALLRHYRAHGRDLPWRRTRDPYAIWVSEIMCQQTRVDTVVPRYAEFLACFPTIEALAAAGANRVCEAWAGLGYYSRARNLHAAAVEVVRDHDGRLPHQVRELRRLPGIGRYTAGAIASVAFAQQAPIVDGNVARVLARLFAIDGAAKETAVQHRLWSIAGELVIGAAPGDLNQALMDLGATICRQPPRCDECPVRRWCCAYANGDPTRYPQAAAPVARRNLSIAFVWIETRAGVWLWRRPLEGMWAGLWEPPSESGRGGKMRLAERLDVELGRPVIRVRHELTHRRVIATLYRPARAPRLHRSQSLRPYADPLAAPLSGLARKTITQVLERTRLSEK